jgi:hypothetical protein
MNPILGYFLFILQGRGVLVSTFSHTRADRLLSEAAVFLRDGGAGDNFVGVYLTTWIDGVNQVPPSTQAWLQIILRADLVHYDLIWFASNNTQNLNAANILFRGEGMVIGDQLVGAYWNHDIPGARP